MKPTPTQIEAACAAVILGEDQHGNPVHLQPSEAEAALSAALSVPAEAVVGEPEGWTLVPIVPTQRMIDAGKQWMMNCRFNNFDAGAVIHWAERGFYQVKAEAASRISQQDAELERLRREVEEAREQARFAKASDQAGDEYIENMRGAIAALKVELAEARKAAFIEVAEMASLSSSPSVYAFAAMIRAKAEETRA